MRHYTRAAAATLRLRMNTLGHSGCGQCEFVVTLTVSVVLLRGRLRARGDASGTFPGSEVPGNKVRGG
jgi:hypothetical protein